jgi:hypothetical protein
VEECLYMEQPQGYHLGRPGQVLSIKKAIYGLKQASRAWNTKMRGELEQMGLEQANADPCLYICKGKQLYMFTHVDDMFIMGPGEAVTAVKQQIAGAFKCKDQGECNYFLGMSITRDRTAGTITLSQPQLIKELLRDFRMEDCQPAPVPLSPGLRLRAGQGEPLGPAEVTEYQRLVGSLMYISTCTRPDISFSANLLARYLQAPTKEQWKAGMGVLRFLKGTVTDGLVFGRGSISDGLEGFADADWASNADDMRSTTGHAFLLGRTAIHWQSKRQPTVALNTVEAEYMATSTAAREGLWLGRLVRELGVGQGAVDVLVIRSDNTGSIQTANNPILSPRTKHIDIQHHFVRDRVERGELRVEYVSTHEQVADFLTKAMTREKQEYCRGRIGLVPLAQGQRGSARNQGVSGT